MDKMKKKESMFFMTWKRLAKNKLAVAGLIVLIITALLAVFAPVAAPYGYEEQDLFNTLAGPSREHWLGTDNLGRDMLSRLIYGGRNSLTLGLISVALAAALGVVLGAVSGYYGGKVDMVIMRLLDVLQAVPAILLAIAGPRIYELYPGADDFPDSGVYPYDEGILFKCTGDGICGSGSLYQRKRTENYLQTRTSKRYFTYYRTGNHERSHSYSDISQFKLYWARSTAASGRVGGHALCRQKLYPQ